MTHHMHIANMEEAKDLIRKAQASELRLLEAIQEKDAEIARLRAALKPFAEFARKFDAKPHLQRADDLYGIHAGTEWEAVIRLSDCRAALKALGEEG